MPTRDANAVASKWATNLAAAANSGVVAAGIDAVTVPPGQAAARQKQAWVTNTPAAADRWAANTSAVSLPSWQASAKDKGVPRIADGATKAEPKMATFMAKLLPAINTAKANLPARGTFQANLQRANAMATALHNLKGSFR
jgi:hypothetical protein